jgi:hypothetical protein
MNRRSRIWNNPVAILCAFRDGQADNWPSICKHCGLNPSGFGGTAESVLCETLNGLIQAGYLTCEGGSEENYDFGFHFYESSKETPIKLKPTDKVSQFQYLFRLSLKEVSKLNRGSMIVSPLLGPPRDELNAPDVLVLMPFSTEFLPIYEDHMKSVVERAGYSVARVDDFFSDASIINNIWELINASRVIIADCTTRNPNVFYEIGLAHVVGKPVVFVTQRKEDVPFDIGHLRYIQYQYTPRGMQEFESDLDKALTPLLQDPKDEY